MEYQLISPINQLYTPTQQVLTNRGIAAAAIDHYLHPTSADNLPPQLFRNMKPAAVCLMNHISYLISHDEARIWLVVDCDCDGMTASALLLNYIYRRFPSIVNRFVYLFHTGKQHGLPDMMQSIQAQKGDLVIMPDASSNDYNEHKWFANRGIDVLVLDHHIADYESPYAIVVNNQLCDYPTKSLSGVGVVYKFCQYLDQELFHDNLADQFLDIVAVGLCGDMMTQQDIETHYLTQLGITRLRNPFIAGMADKNSYSIGDTISPFKVQFYIVPLINAIMRVGTMAEKKLLFESMLEWKANEIIPSTKRGAAVGSKETRLAQALRVATNVKNRQTTQQDNALAAIEAKIQSEHLLDHKVLVIQLDNTSFDRGITGLIANKLMAEYSRPVCLLVKTIHEGQLAWSGSARGYGKSKLTDFRQFCRDSGLVYLAEGHPQAFGCGILDSNIKAFIALADEKLKELKFEPSYKVDFIYNPSTVSLTDIAEIGNLSYLWGQEVPEPLVAIEHVQVTASNIVLMKSTLKIELPNGLALLKFRSSEEEYNNLLSKNGSVTINIVGTCNLNRYYNQVIPQIIIEDYEVIDRKEWYF